ncbi:MAG: sigma-70 family RNA polymerase sigma factor [Actinomycetota bacterium]|nr:sigma-70 family RNA polymerase sigma factor [Actinomycetota bacterium]
MWLSDDSLLAGLASGDPQLGAAFVRRFQSRVYGLAYAILGDRDAAEEVAQETFIRAWKYAGAYDPRKGRVASWLLTIARNQAADVRRLQRPDRVDPEVLVSLPSTDPHPEDRGVAAAESARLHTAVARLPEDQRRALVLAAFHGRTAREIGIAERIPLGTAKTRIRTAMLKLRDALEVRDEG